MIPICILAIEDDSDREFMTNLFLQYKRLMYSEIVKIVPNDTAVDDILQDTLVKLIKQLQKLRRFERDQLVNYIITAVQHMAINYLRDQKVIVPFDDCLETPDSEQEQAIIEEHLAHEEAKETLERIWPKLDARNQYLLESRYILEKPMDVIAQELGIKPESVRMALTRARKAAYELLEKEN